MTVTCGPAAPPSGPAAPTAVDLAAFTDWAKALRLGPGDLRHRDVRRYAASLSAEGKASTTVARHLAAIRGLYDFLVRTEQIGSNPAELVSSPKRRRSCRRC